MFKEIFSTATWKQSQITVLGTLINGILGVLFYTLVARFLGPSDFGILVVSTVTLTMLGDILDFGINTGLVRFVSSYLKTEKQTALRFLKLSLILKLFIWILVLSLGLILSRWMALFIFKRPELEFPLKLVFGGVGGALLFSFTTSALQAFQKYTLWSFVNILTNAIRLILIFFLFYLGELNLSFSLLTYITLPFVGFFIGLLFLPTKDFLSVKNEFSVFDKLFKFNIWVAIFTSLAAISARLDTYISARLLPPADLGLYGAANQLTQAIPQLVSALGVVVAPKFASFTNHEGMITYLKKLQLLVLCLGLLIIVLLPIAIYLLPIFLGYQYIQSTPSLIILTIAMVVFLISLPVHSAVIFYFSKPVVFVWLSIGHLLLVGIGGYLIVSKFGLIGASFTVLVGNIFNLLLPTFWLLFKLKK